MQFALKRCLFACLEPKRKPVQQRPAHYIAIERECKCTAPFTFFFFFFLFEILTRMKARSCYCNAALWKDLVPRWKKLINKSQRERLNYVQSAWIGMAQHFVSSANLNFFGALHERDWYISSWKYHIPMKINILTRTKKRDFLTSQGLLMFHISDYCLPACWIFLFSRITKTRLRREIENKKTRYIMAALSLLRCQVLCGPQPKHTARAPQRCP